jgi:hypothetical protein
MIADAARCPEHHLGRVEALSATPPLGPCDGATRYAGGGKADNNPHPPRRIRLRPCFRQGARFPRGVSSLGVSFFPREAKGAMTVHFSYCLQLAVQRSQ